MEMLTPECKYPFLVFDDVIPQKDLKGVFEELNYLQKFGLDPNEVGSALDIYGNPKKNNRCVWLNNFYNLSTADKNSYILKNVKQFFSVDISSAIRNYDRIFSHYIPDRLVPKTGYLLSMYSDGNYYLPHEDDTLYTAVLWLNEEPKKYEGGEFFFHFDDGTVEEVECKCNRMVLFPSFYQHEVRAVKYTQEDSFPRCSVSLLMG
jgi:Rps23 Pro-64 3,4-dihydroxylase Tpa1-like proline 4-hydroxylase